MPVTGPTVTRRQLGRRLKALRRAAGMTVDQLAVTTGGVSQAKLYRIEGGKAPVKPADVWALCRIYNADSETTDALGKLAEGTNGKSWWQDYGEIPEEFELYLGLEMESAALRIFEPERVHGLFQTADYAREIERATNIGPSVGEDVIERVVSLRMERQRTVLNRRPPGQITTVLGAGALARQVGGKRVMTEQTDRLREVTRLDHVDTRVLSFDVGAHAAMLGAFAVLDFEDPDDPSLAYIETYSGARIVEEDDKGTLQRHRAVFDSIYRQATPIERYRQ